MFRTSSNELFLFPLTATREIINDLYKNDISNNLQIIPDYKK